VGHERHESAVTQNATSETGTDRRIVTVSPALMPSPHRNEVNTGQQYDLPIGR
jgi:hypothetical protein